MPGMAERKPVLIMQDTWLRWTKAKRAAADADGSAAPLSCLPDAATNMRVPTVF